MIGEYARSVQSASRNDMPVEKICAACGKSKGRSFYRKQQWELKGSKRCSECLRHKNPKPGGREIWHAMTQAIFLK
jgi:hypothetical protein